MTSNKSYKIEYYNLKSQIGKGNQMDWILNFKREEGGRPYYINQKTGEEVAAGSDRKPPYKDIFDKENGLLHVINEETGQLVTTVNYRNVWEIKPIKEFVNLPLSEINVNIRQISGNELEKLIENNKSYDPDDFDFDFSVPNDWLGHGYAITTPGKIKAFVPNRFLLKGPRSRFMIVPMFYLENINNNKKIIEIVRGYITEEIKKTLPRSVDKLEKKLEYLEEIIKNNGSFWLAISRFDIMVNKRDNVIKAHIDHAYGDHLKKGAGKIVTCFLVKYLKEIYPENEIEVTLQDSGGSGRAWSRHGFERKEGLSSGGIESASHILNLEKNERICDEAMKEFDITEFLYYDLTTEARREYYMPHLDKES